MDCFVFNFLVAVCHDKPEVVSIRRCELFVVESGDGIVQLEINGEIGNLRRTRIARESYDA